MLLKSAEMNVELMERLKESAERSALGHHGEGINILWEALATIAELAVRTRDVGVGVVYVAGEEHASMHFAPVATHLLAILAASIEVGYLVGSEDVVHVLGELGFEGTHDGEFLAYEDLGEEVLCSGEDHGLLLEVFDVSAFCEKLWHVVYLVSRLSGEHVACSGENSGSDKHGYIGQFLD